MGKVKFASKGTWPYNVNHNIRSEIRTQQDRDQMHKGILMLTSVVFSLYVCSTWVVWIVLTQKIISILAGSHRGMREMVGTTRGMGKTKY